MTGSGNALPYLRVKTERIWRTSNLEPALQRSGVEGTQQRPCQTEEEKEFLAEEVLKVTGQEGVIRKEEEGQLASKRRCQQRRSFSPALPILNGRGRVRVALSVGRKCACMAETCGGEVGGASGWRHQESDHRLGNVEYQISQGCRRKG